jgi:hypothetical protein
MAKGKGTNNDLQNITQKTKDRATRTPLNIRRELKCSGKVGSSCSTCDTRRVNFVASSVSLTEMIPCHVKSN